MRRKLLIAALAVATVAVTSGAVAVNANAAEQPATARTMSTVAPEAGSLAALSAADGPCHWSIAPTAYTQYGATVYNAAEVAVECDYPVAVLEVRIALVYFPTNTIVASDMPPRQYDATSAHAFAVQIPCSPGTYYAYPIIMITLPPPFFEQPVIKGGTAPVELGC